MQTLQRALLREVVRPVAAHGIQEVPEGISFLPASNDRLLAKALASQRIRSLEYPHRKSPAKEHADAQNASRHGWPYSIRVKKTRPSTDPAGTQGSTRTATVLPALLSHLAAHRLGDLRSGSHAAGAAQVPAHGGEHGLQRTHQAEVPTRALAAVGPATGCPAADWRGSATRPLTPLAAGRFSRQDEGVWTPQLKPWLATPSAPRARRC